MAKSETKTKRLSFDVSEQIYTQIETNAKKENRSIANYMRTVIEKLLAKKEKQGVFQPFFEFAKFSPLK